MSHQTTATHVSLLVHAVFFFVAVGLGQHAVPLRPPVAIDFSILSTGGSMEVQQEKISSPPAKKKDVAEPKKISPKAVARKVRPKPVQREKTSVPPREKDARSEALPVAAQPRPSTGKEVLPDAGQTAATATVASGPAAASPPAKGGRGGLYAVGQLDAPLAVVSKTPPAYPPAAKRRNIEGWIKVKFVVDEQGRVDHVSVLDAEPEGVFEQSVLRSIGGWRFKPGTIKGMAVKAQVEQTITFKLEG
ncbi:TonB family protein [Desulfobulbus propionicus DSM 2032]|uniref:TonB family protein n=1 Tax=Desulfobulbus propionicus (strain ATCC 33891 / DSM 2032 / VKM B-1956 / 1pr3) TaxID=577650 RepID=A0A7U3YLL7_DESPD|nr:energy transducer TonB [Desulfobulbus propionicus]ADW17661.1 TonB family protein [Desulfobulbus propionicus DSM 2032]